MFCLIRVSSVRWCVGFEPNGVCEQVGLDEAIAILRSFGISFKEIEAGIAEMIRNGHDVCEWGVCCTVTYTRKAREEMPLAA